MQVLSRFLRLVSRAIQLCNDARVEMWVLLSKSSEVRFRAGLAWLCHVHDLVDLSHKLSVNTCRLSSRRVLGCDLRLKRLDSRTKVIVLKLCCLNRASQVIDTLRERQNLTGVGSLVRLRCLS